MPGTIDGIGTKYYGKRNLKTHQGVCGSCHRETLLDEYETWLCATVFYIPIFPLGKKKILDYCRCCRRHRVMPLSKWRQIEKETTQEAIQHADANPDDPEAAIRLHATLVTFGRADEARQMADIMADKFARDVDVLIYLGGWFFTTGQDRRGDACFAKALALAPDNLDARRAVGLSRLQEGQLAQAWELLSFMEQPGPMQDPVVLVLVANGFQEAGDHEMALRLYAAAGRVKPALLRDKTVGRRVRQSEAALGRTASLAPRSKKPLVIAALAVMLVLAVLGGLTATNGYLAQHQTLQAVNGLNEPVDVAIDGQSQGSLIPGQRREIPIAEGKHQAVIRQDGRVVDTIDFEIKNGPMQRMAQSSVFVLNPRAAADLLWQKAVYRVNPRDDETDHRIHFGDKFMAFRGIDYVFKEFPAKLDMGKNSSVAKTRIGLLPVAPALAFGVFPEGTPPAELMRYAECHLTANPYDETLVGAYCYLACTMAKEVDRAKRFFEAGLDRRPVAVQWHRMYQDLADQTGDSAGLIARYDRALKAEPDNSALLYLRGRIEPDQAEAGRYFDRAIAADPKNPLPLYAKTFVLVSRGQFAAAKPLAVKTCDLAPDNLEMTQRLDDIRFALKEYAAMEKELRARLESSPLDSNSHGWLLRVLVAGGQPAAARQAQEAFAAAFQASVPTDRFQIVLREQMFLHYLLEEMEDARQCAGQLANDANASLEAAALLIELGRLEDAEKRLEAAGETATAEVELALSVAWRRRDNAAKAARWLDSCLARLRNGSTDDRETADLLASDKAPSLEQIDRVAILPQRAPLLLVALAQRFPDQRAAYLQRVSLLNALGPFPYHFVRKTIEELSR